MFQDKEDRPATEQGKRNILEAKKAEVISKFSEKLTNGDFMLNPTFHKIIMCLMYGENPYSIIEQLVENQETLIKELIEIKERGTKFYVKLD